MRLEDFGERLIEIINELNHLRADMLLEGVETEELDEAFDSLYWMYRRLQY